MDKNTLDKKLVDFFLDSLHQDAADVANWCEHCDYDVYDIVAAIEFQVEGPQLR